jgi:1A family penicillin-binding protein
MRVPLRARFDELIHWLQRAVPLTPSALRAIPIAGALLLTLTTIGTLWLLLSAGRGLPDREAVRHIGDMDEATAIYDNHDQLAFTLFKEQRIEVRLADVSPLFIRALLATEDRRFYDHRGIDVFRLASAAMANIRQGRAAEGASTITQQLARLTFLKPDKTIHRKLQEIVLASRIERLYTKEQILELYLNKVYFGSGLYGIEAAARGYFAKHASQLTVAESALLAGLVKSPSSYAPTVSMNRALARQHVVLQSMADAGVIDRRTLDSARAEKITLRDGLRNDDPHGQYFKEEVRRELIERFGGERAYRGGLRVFTTIDMPMQLAAESSVAASLTSIDARRKSITNRRAATSHAVAEEEDTPPMQAALIAMDPATGDVRAMVGGRDFRDSSFNRAIQAHRQPGSAFKPFVYATALEAGYTPASLIDRLDEPVATNEGTWTPEDEHSTESSMTMRAALRTSSNRAAIRVLTDVGIARTVQYAKRLGIGDVPSVPSLALGSGEVTLEAMTAAYAAFANHGFVPQPRLVRRVEDRDGAILYEAPRPAPTRAIRDSTAFLMATMMADVVNEGTGARARAVGFKLPAGGKTGTTNDFRDAWFVGFTPKLATGVWVGLDRPQTILPRGFAGDIAVPLWATFMKQATAHDQPEWLMRPPGITTAVVCRVSGLLAGAGCGDVEVEVEENDHTRKRKSMIYTEYFVSGTEPKTVCPLHPAGGIALNSVQPSP